MYLKSPYPSVPAIPNDNYHNLLFNSPGQQAQEDYVLHVDGLTGRRRTRKEFDELIKDGATALGAAKSQGGLGLSGEKRDVVAIYSPNCLDYIALEHSLLMIATPFALISAFSTQHELVHCLRTTKPTHLFVHSSLLLRALRASKEVHLPENRIFILEGIVPEGRQSFAGMILKSKNSRITRISVRPAKKDTLAYLVFSSGTSGLPKALMISHGNLWFMTMAQMIVVKEEWKLHPPPARSLPLVILAALPFHHSYGLHIFCLRGFLSPSTFVILPRWNHDVVLHVIPKYKINMMATVPSVLHQFVNTRGLEVADLSSVTSVLCGAAHLPEHVEKKLKNRLNSIPPINTGYGLSEATVAVSLMPAPGVLGRKPVSGSVGILLPGMEAHILREDGSETAVDEPGELWLRGDNIALGYHNNPKATQETFVNGWLRTGDRFRADSNGMLYFVDRIKDTMKISGVQVSPTEIENILLAHPKKLISDVSVAGVSRGRVFDEKVPRAWIALSEEGRRLGRAATIRELDNWVKQNLSSYKWVRGGYQVVDEIPKLPTGKTLRRVLQEGYEQSRIQMARL